MKSIKATLLLGGITTVVVLLAVVGGWMSPIQEAWKGVLPITPADAGSSELAHIVQGVFVFLLAFMTVGIGLEVDTHKGRFFLMLFTGVLMISGSLVLALYHFFWNPFPAELALGFKLPSWLFFSFEQR